jgi:hypothetical protein
MRRHLPYALVATLILSAPAAAQSTGFLEDLKREALGFARGCDYVEYLNAAYSLAENWDVVKDLTNWRPSSGVRGIPVTDYISAIFQRGAEVAAKNSAESQAKSLMFQLEQTCQLVEQADEVNRMRQLFTARNFNIGKALDWLKETLADVDLERTPGTTEDSLGRDYASIYEPLLPYGKLEQDSIFRGMQSVLYSTVEAADDMLRSLTFIQRDLNRLREELLLKAEPARDDDGNIRYRGGAIIWECPEGYPDPSDPSSGLGTDPDGVPICGPASPERSQQILAATEVLKTQLMAIQQAAEARQLEMAAVRLMSDNHHRKERNWLNRAPARK